MLKKLFVIFICTIIITTILPVVAININEKKYFDPIIKLNNDIDWWPMQGHDPQHTGFSKSGAPDVNKLNWSFDTDSNIRFSSSIVVENKLYIGTGEIGSLYLFDFNEIKNKPVIGMYNKYCEKTFAETGGIFCIDTITGMKLWDFVTQGAVSSTPVFYNGYVYVLTSSSETYEGYLYCIDAETGLKQWNFTYTNLITTPIIDNNNLYVTIADPHTGYGKLLCLDPSDGAEKWNHSTGYYNFAMYSAPAAYNNRVCYVSINSSDIELHSVDAITGEDQWTIFLTKMEIGLIVSSPVIVENRIFVMSLESYLSNETVYSVLFCIDAEDGDVLWKYVMKENDISLSSPAIADDVVYFSYVENYWAYGGIACLNISDGEIIWDQKLYYDFFTVSSPSIADEKLFIGSMNLLEYKSFLNCFDINSSALLWRYSIGELAMVDSSAAIANEKVYIANYFGTIFAFIDNTPPNTPVIDGPLKGKPEKSLDYSFYSIDSDGDKIAEYIINWSDGTGEQIITGPFTSGEQVIVNHTWKEKGIYIIKAKSKDSFGDESNWSHFEVNIPRTRTNFNPLLYWLFEHFPLLEGLLRFIK